MQASVKLEGAQELHEALRELPRSTERGVLRRVGIAALIPFAKRAAASVARRTGRLAFSIGVGTKLSRRQSSLHQKVDDVEIFAGPAALPQATLEEFGSVHNQRRAAIVPAWDAEKGGILPFIGSALWVEIEKTLARRAARAKASGP